MRDLITQAVATLGIGESVKLVEPYRFRAILERIITCRTTLSKAAISAPWLWESLRPPVSCLTPAEPVIALRSVLPARESVWFVAEDADSPAKSIGNFWLYEATTDAVCSLLPELPHFEYYVVSKKCDWLVCENHHGLLIASGEPMSSLVTQLPDPSVKGTSCGKPQDAPYVER